VNWWAQPIYGLYAKKYAVFAMPMNFAEQVLILRPPADLLQSQPGLGRMSRELALRYAHRELVTDDRLRTLGEAL